MHRLLRKEKVLITRSASNEAGGKAQIVSLLRVFGLNLKKEAGEVRCIYRVTLIQHGSLVHRCLGITAFHTLNV